MARYNAGATMTMESRQSRSQLAAIVRRCEEVALAEVVAAIMHGARGLQAVTLFPRLGMGSCQGRTCAPAMDPYICRATRQIPQQAGRIDPRLPVKPVPFGTLAAMAIAAGGDSHQASLAEVVS